MTNTVLKKEFTKKDVNRLRNLVKGKGDSSTVHQVGYKKPYIKRNEGEIWEEDGKSWIIKNGIKQNITKLDKIKESIIPLFCPNCKKLMHYYDKDYFKVHKMCFNCVVDFEHDLRKKGLYEDYHKNLHNNEIDNFINNYKLWVEEKLNDTNSSFVTEGGDIEKWMGGYNKKQVLEEIDKTIEYLETLKK